MHEDQMCRVFGTNGREECITEFCCGNLARIGVLQYSVSGDRIDGGRGQWCGQDQCGSEQGQMVVVNTVMNVRGP